MTWGVGDLAVCVDAGTCRCGCQGSLGLEVGRRYKVTSLRTSPLGNPWLGFADHYYAPCGHLFGGASWRFRKVVHDTREACEPEFVTLLKRIKRPAPAETASDWLLRAGPIAKELNEQSRKDQ